jgi:hypothetical protein
MAFGKTDETEAKQHYPSKQCWTWKTVKISATTPFAIQWWRNNPASFTRKKIIHGTICKILLIFSKYISFKVWSFSSTQV